MSTTTCVILVPYTGSIVPACEEGLRVLEQRGYAVRRVPGISAIDVGRCLLATGALHEGFDELMWIDSDMGFDPADVDRLRGHGLPFVCGLGAKKGIRGLACEFLPETRHVTFGHDGGLLGVKYVGLAFALTRREVYDQLRTSLSLPACDQGVGPPMVSWFQPMTVTDGAVYRYLAEDYAFCHRLHQCGIPVLIDTRIRLLHFGLYGYTWEDAGADKPRFRTYTIQVRPPAAPARPGPGTGSPQPPGTAAPPEPDPAPAAPGYFDHDRPELVARIPETAARVLDVGCGAGRFGAALKARRPTHVVGIERDPRAAAAAATRLDEVVVGDAEGPDVRFAPGTFDAVVCGDVLEHLRDPREFLRRVRGWLAPDGVLVASVPNVRHVSVLQALVTGNWTYEPAGLLDAGHLRFFTRRELEKLLFRAGFSPTAVEPVIGPEYAGWASAGSPPAFPIAGAQIGPMRAEDVGEFFTYQWLATARPDDAPEPDLTSVVIVAFNQLDHTRRCVDYLRHLTDEPFELILVDNGSADGTPAYFAELAATDPRVRVIGLPENVGFPAGANHGLRAAIGKQVVLLNNDTVVTTGWLRHMLAPLRGDPTIGLVGPCTNYAAGPQRIPAEYIDTATLDGFGWERAKAGAGWEVTDRLAGFCLLITREVIDRVGLLDEQFGVGNYEDDDYCERVGRAGFKAVIARGAFVHHVGGQTFRALGADYLAALRGNLAKFRAKWGPDVKSLSAEETLPEADPQPHLLPSSRTPG